MIPSIQLDDQSDLSIYRQLYQQIRSSILDGRLSRGERLPPTRELAASLGLNRTTIAAAYELLEREGLIEGQVGRGSYVAGTLPEAISFATSRPVDELFPIAEFRRTVADVTGRDGVESLLQLGSPQGLPALRQCLSANPDEVLITSGCQQALDLLQRLLAPVGTPVLVEDPTYPGLKNVFERGGARLIPYPGFDAGARLAIVTPNFQNPTGRTMTISEREQLLRDARERRLTIIELDIYSQLRYRGEHLPSLRELDDSNQVIQIGSFSKVAFPGLRCGWILGPRAVITRLTEVKQWTDLHSDQLSQAVMLRFMESGRLNRHIAKVLEHGARQLDTVLAALEAEMPRGTEFTRPDGGMNLWVRLPPPLDAAALLEDALRAGVGYLPAHYFTVARPDRGAFRLSFGGLTPERIARGVALLGQVFRRQPAGDRPELVTAIV
jgi:2-aminoadipate transaminase